MGLRHRTPRRELAAHAHLPPKWSASSAGASVHLKEDFTEDDIIARTNTIIESFIGFMDANRLIA
jgi:hypothetical protein